MTPFTPPKVWTWGAPSGGPVRQHQPPGRWCEKTALRRREDAARHESDAKQSKLDFTRRAQADADDEALRRWRDD